MRIKELARHAGCSTHTIRYYERQGFFEPGRSPANHRVYGFADLERLRFVRTCRVMGLSLAEIRTLAEAAQTPSADCGAISRVLARHSELLGARIRLLRGVKAEVDSIRKQCSRGSADRCLILKALRSNRVAPAAESK